MNQEKTDCRSPEITINSEHLGDTTLDGQTAQKILPYLSLDSLSDSEKSDILKLSDKLFDSIQRNGILYDNNISIRHFVEKQEKDSSGEQQFKSESYKLFASNFLERLNTEMQSEDKQTIVALILCSGEHVFSSCDFEDQLELLSISERSDNLSMATRQLYRTMIDGERFREENRNDFLEILQKASPTKQLQLLPVMAECRLFCDEYDKTAKAALRKILADFAGHINSTESPTRKNKVIENILEQKTNGEIMRGKIDCAFEYLLSSEKTTPLIRIIASDLMVQEDDPNQTNYKTYNKRQIYSGRSAHDTDLLNAAHNPRISELISDELSLNILDISLDAQIQLLKFMTEAGDTRYDSLCGAMKNFESPEMRRKFAESFLAADFGEDFGDSLLTIAGSESLSNKEKEKIFDQIESCRESIAKITELYKGIDDGAFAKEYARAANERLTDAIMAFSQIAEDGSARADLDWVGEINLNYDSAIEALEYETKSLEIISGTFEDVISGVDGAYAERFMSPDESHNRSFYSLFSPSHGHVLLYTRPEGSGEFDPSIEYGKYRSAYNEEENVGVEASISMITNPVQPFELPVPFRPTRRVMRMLGGDEEKIERIRNKISAIRLDREGRAPDGATRNVGRDPINPIGTISVDLAAILDDEDTPSGKIARLFSTGNKIRAEKRGESEFSLNHNTNWFDQDRYGTSVGFSRLVKYIDSQMAGLCTVYPPKPGEGMTGEMKAKQRRRYRKMGGGAMGRAA